MGFLKGYTFKGGEKGYGNGGYTKKVKEEGRKAGVLCAAEITTKVTVQMARERAKQKDQ